MNQTQCGHTQGDDLHCSGCGHTWKEIYAEARAEHRLILEKIQGNNALLSEQYTAAYWAMKRVAEGMKRSAGGMVEVATGMDEVEQALRHFQEVEAKWPERGVLI